MVVIYAFFIFLTGASLTSFYGVVGSRVPKKQSINGRSVCDHCQTELSSKALIPILGYVLMRGKCPRCEAKVSPKYPLFEFLGGTLFVCGYLLNPDSVIEVVSYTIVLSIILIAVFSAFENEILPHSIAVGGLLMMLVLRAVHPFDDLLDMALSILFIFVLYAGALLLRNTSIQRFYFSMNELKLMALSSLLLGFKLSLTVMIFFIVCLIITEGLFRQRPLKRIRVIAFGVFVLSLYIGYHLPFV